MSGATLVDVMVVRIYLPDAPANREPLLRRLRDWGHLRGATLFEGARGFGASHDGRAVFNPVVVEFYELAERAEEVMTFLDGIVPSGHIICWPAKMRSSTHDAVE